MKRIIILFAAALAVIAAPVAHADNRVIYGEFQTVHNVTPPTRLDIMMYNGRLNGLTVTQRCANMGGQLWNENLPQFGNQPVCHGVDY